MREREKRQRLASKFTPPPPPPPPFNSGADRELGLGTDRVIIGEVRTRERKEKRR